ncbi:hypothetical protein ONZ45_g1055 [Pleurotus djamor]|nr:hypothetical protein ONZ45_g1055 [Pleurotus djamor]
MLSPTSPAGPLGSRDSDPCTPSAAKPMIINRENILASIGSEHECEELALQLLASLPRSRLATIRRRIAPLLQFDVVGSLPTELSLQIFSQLTAQTLSACSLVNKRWRTLANDPSLWKRLCDEQGWTWKHPSKSLAFEERRTSVVPSEEWNDTDDEGMGDSDEEEPEEATTTVLSEVEKAKILLTRMHAELDSGLASMSANSSFLANLSLSSSSSSSSSASSTSRLTARQHSSPPMLKSPSGSPITADYRLLYQTHMRLCQRFRSANYRCKILQPRSGSVHGHTNTIYCLQLYTYPSGKQVLFTGSRDRSVREWNLQTHLVERVISGIHESSVLSICVHGGFLASAGSDRMVAVWDLTKNELVKVMSDHEDSVLCVRFDDERLVSCSKDRTVRTYTFPDLTPQFVFGAHRAAVNAVSISKSLIVSASGDRSIRLWDARTGALLQTFEDHHSRGIASIDFKPPFVVSGSSDKHLRLFDMTSMQGWSTSTEYHYEGNAAPEAPLPFHHASTDFHCSHLMMCQACGSLNMVNTLDSPASNASGSGSSKARANAVDASSGNRCTHKDLVRSVAFGQHFVLSGSYDLTIKVWDRKTGALVANLKGGHTGRIFCIGFDYTKIVSCGEDQVRNSLP